jgi:hypothetical protein
MGSRRLAGSGQLAFVVSYEDEAALAFDGH